MKHSLAAFLFLATMLIVGGCATSRSGKPMPTPKSEEPVMQGRPSQPQAPEPAAPATTTPSSPPIPARQKAPAEPPVAQTPTPALPAGEYAVLIESDPMGATVVINGIPIGKTPQRVILPGTTRGFFRDQVSLKVRFIAGDATQSSQTVEEMLTPLDKIPATVRFTNYGATRVARH